MKYLSALAVSIALLSGCSSVSTDNQPLNTFGPLVVEIANERIAVQILKGHPETAVALMAFANALGTITDSTNVGEITDGLIRTFVSSNGPKWGLLPAEQQLVSDGLVAARQVYLSNMKLNALNLSDPNVKNWIKSIQQGIILGVDASK